MTTLRFFLSTVLSPVRFLRKNLVFLQVGYTSLSYEHFRQTSQYDSGALMGESSFFYSDQYHWIAT